MVRFAPVEGSHTPVSAEQQVGVFTKLWLVLWKNCIYCRRHWVLLVVQFLFAILAMAGFVVFHNTWNLPQGSTFVNSSTVVMPAPLLRSAARYVPPLNPMSEPEDEDDEDKDSFEVLRLSGKTHNSRLHLLYFPKTPFVENIMQFVQLNWQEDSPLTPVTKEEEIDEHSILADLGQNEEFLGGLIFILDHPVKPKVLRLRLKLHKNPDHEPWETALLFPKERVREPTPQYAEAYRTSHFLVLQHLVALQFIELTTRYPHSSTQIQLKVQPFPFPPYYKKGMFLFIREVMLPLAIILCYIAIVYLLIKNIVEEKHTGIKEVMKIAGLPTWIQQFGWFLCCFILMTIISTVVVGLLCIPFTNEAILNASRPDIFALVLLCYTISSLFFCFFISWFFPTPTLAGGVGIIIWFLSYFVPVNILYPKYNELNLFEKLLICILPNMTLVWAMKIISLYENEGTGLHWHNINTPALTEEDLTLQLLLIAFSVDAVVYAVLFVVIVILMPGHNNLIKPWYYLFLRNRDDEVQDIDSPVGSGSDEGVLEIYKARRFTWLPWVRGEQTHSLHLQSPFEKEPSGIKACITLRHITKRFGWFHHSSIAVDDVSLKVYERQVTTLLGADGSGKSTILVMIAGMLRPTSGAAFIEGHNVWIERAKAQRLVSICPQNNMLFPELTVKEHLFFFAKLKGAPHISEKIERLMYKLHLSTSSKKMITELPIGTQRKLHLAIAFIGSAKVVILDEPTSRVDPEARRVIWTFLQELQQEYCILLTTHYMEEADVLGNRVAIMANGRILCHGTAHFLKDRYGSGFYLHVLKGRGIRVNKVVCLVRNFVVNANLNRETCTELSFAVPSHSTWPFPDLFVALARKREHLGIIGFGVSGTTMEEVYYAATKKIARKPKRVKFGVPTSPSPEPVARTPSISPPSGRSPASSPTPSSSSTALDSTTDTDKPFPVTTRAGKLAFQQLRALLVKKLQYMRHDWCFVFCQVLLPAVFIFYLLQVAATRTMLKRSEQWPLIMNISEYPGTLTTLYNFTGPTNSIADHYRNLFPSNVIVEHQDNVEKKLLSIGKTKFEVYRTEYVLAATFDATFDLNSTNLKIFNICAMYNILHVHSVPMSVNLVHNALLAEFYTGDLPYPHIVVENAPFFRQPCLAFDEKQKLVRVLTVLFSVLALGLCILSATFFIAVSHERTSHFKNLQLQTGLSSSLFWASILLIDAVVYFGSSVVSLTVVAVFAASHQLEAVWDGLLLCHVFLVIVLYCWCALPFTYLVSFIGGSIPTIFVCVLLGFNFVSALSLDPLLDFMSNIDGIPKELRIFFLWLFRFLPPFCLMRALQHIPSIAVSNGWCNCDEATMKTICSSNTDAKIAVCCKGFHKRMYLEWGSPPDFPPDSVPGIGPEVFMLLMCSWCYILLLILLDGNFVRKLNWFLPFRYVIPLSNTHGSDIDLEEQRVNHGLDLGSSAEDVLLVHNLCKMYSFSRLVVHNVSFGIHRGECLGLLGVSGAGKTSILRVLTGCTVVTSGEVVLVNVSNQPRTAKFFSRIGYCPQHEGLLHYLTGRETLTLFAQLYGFDKHEVDDRVAEFISALGLTDQANQLVKNFSQDSKRKLSTAIAYMGDKDVVLLDEPTTGLMPEDKHKIWEMIQLSKRHGTAMLLTSKSIEECELLCDRIAIMIHGKFLCIGTIQELKKKFGEGVSLTFRMSEKDFRQLQHLQFHLEDFIDLRFKNYYVRDISQGVCVINIPKDSQVSWRHVFTVLEEAIIQFPLTDYSVSEAPLEQILYSFTEYTPEEIPMSWVPH